MILLTVAGLIATAFAVARRRRRARPTESTNLRPEEALGGDRPASDLTDTGWRRHVTDLLCEVRHRDRAQLCIELVQVSPGGNLEVSFAEIPDVPPPAPWRCVALRVWLLAATEAPIDLRRSKAIGVINPIFVKVDQFVDDTSVYLNIAAPAGINVIGDRSLVQAWIEHTISSATSSENAGSLLVLSNNDDLSLPAPVERLDETGLLQRLQTLGLINKDHDSRRPATGRQRVIVVLTKAASPAWDIIVGHPNLTVLSTSNRFAHGLNINVNDDGASIASLELSSSSLLPTGATAAAAAPPVTASTVVMQSHPVEQTQIPEIDDDWEPPTWRVVMKLLGTPHATRDGRPLKLTPQQQSALALIALRREVPAHDFKRAIWGDEDDVSPERVRDMLSVLRKKVGGLSVIPKREDGLVCAGAELGTDLITFEALETRANRAPKERLQRLHQMMDLVTGRPFNYASADAGWWQWSELAAGMTDWTTKVSTTAERLALALLADNDPVGARQVAEHGLAADPMNEALTEILMEIYAILGCPEAVRRVFASHERALAANSLGRVSDETRRRFEDLRDPASTASAE